MRVQRDVKRESIIDLERNNSPYDTIPTRTPSNESYLRPERNI
jgi:hypothetical protein